MEKNRIKVGENRGKEQGREEGGKGGLKLEKR